MSVRLHAFTRLPARITQPMLLDRLAAATADAFGAPLPDWSGRPASERLALYAEFTAAQAGRALAASRSDSRPSAEVAERLYRNARDLGGGCRSLLGIRRPDEAMRALEYLYGRIGIEITGRVSVPAACDARSRPPTGGDADPSDSCGATGPARSLAHQLEVKRCFFAGYYSEPVCRLMSAMDSGVVSGLFGGATLGFSQRITGGHPSCRAVIGIGEPGA